MSCCRRDEKDEIELKTENKYCDSFLMRIDERMKELGITQSELARRMKVSCPYVTKVLHLGVNLSFGTAAKLASALNMEFSPELHPLETRGRISYAMGMRQNVECKSSEVYQKIVNTPPPDLSKVYKDAESFARWIAREHKKERRVKRGSSTR